MTACYKFALGGWKEINGLAPQIGQLRVPS